MESYMDRTVKIRMQKCTCFFLLCLLLTACSAIPAFATEEKVTDAQEAFSDIFDAVDADTKAILSEIGVQQSSYEELLQLSPRKVITALLNLLTGSMTAPLKALGYICAFLVFHSIADSFLQTKSSVQTVFSLFTALWIVLTVLYPVSESLVQAFSAIQLGSNFMLAYIPAFAGVIAMSGKPLTSAAYSALMVGTSNAISQINVKLLLPIVQSFFVLNMTSSIQSKYDLNGFLSFFKRFTCIVLGFASTIFSGMLALKGTLAASGDTVAIRGVKMLVGGALPVVGSTLSEAYTSVLGSIGLIKNAVGVFGILVIACIHLPVILDLLLWYLTASFAGAISGMLGQTESQKLLNGIASTLSLVNVFLVFNAFLLIISTGIILQFKG